MSKDDRTAAVYVQTNEAGANTVIAFRRNEDGGLEQLGAFETGGAGSGVPHGPSQGSVVLTGDGRHPAALWPQTPTPRRWASRPTARRSSSRNGARTPSPSTPSGTTGRWRSRRSPRPRARRPTASPSRAKARSWSPRHSARRRARLPPPRTSSQTARRHLSRARWATAGARSAGPSPPRAGAMSSRRTSPTGPCPGIRSEPTAGSCSRTRRRAWPSTARPDSGTRASRRTGASSTRSTPTPGRIFGWAVDQGGSLSPIGAWAGVPATVAGLAASWSEQSRCRGPRLAGLGGLGRGSSMAP